MSFQRSQTKLLYLRRCRRARRTSCSPTHLQWSLCANGARNHRLFLDCAKALRPHVLSQYAQLTLFSLPDCFSSLLFIIPVGLLYAALAFLLSVCAFLRARHTRHNYADRNDTGDTTSIHAIRTVGQDHKQLFGRPFVTAGRIVALVVCIVAATEIVLLVLVLQL